MFRKVNVKDAMKSEGDIKGSTCTEVMSVAAVKYEKIINDFLTHGCHHLYNQHKNKKNQPISTTNIIFYLSLNQCNQWPTMCLHNGAPTFSLLSMYLTE